MNLRNRKNIIYLTEDKMPKKTIKTIKVELKILLIQATFESESWSLLSGSRFSLDSPFFSSVGLSHLLLEAKVTKSIKSMSKNSQIYGLVHTVVRQKEIQIRHSERDFEFLKYFKTFQKREKN
ncbi:hypothetical protein BpHYR1_026665 [Brachionus plicatilis]|uniref:Uncharacterized protein n=1 Tax=Brachionus plicatilis TaxID=10195 RepID=A0A3M7RUC9_BRAPC|nr:hypothetical protein BpHYR1_026665 [Brachionus plicatilis]